MIVLHSMFALVLLSAAAAISIGAIRAYRVIRNFNDSKLPACTPGNCYCRWTCVQMTRDAREANLRG